MRARITLALALVAAAVAAVASTATGGTAANTLTVWLQTDADQPTWEPIVKAANAEFEKANPGWSVDVQTQTWGNHLQKFDATLAGGNAPDVIEMGNTEMTKYMAAGAFQDLAGISFPNQATWLSGLAASGQVRWQALRCPVLRGVARRHVPHRPVQELRASRSRRASRSSPPGRRSSPRRTSRRASRPSTSPAQTGTSR